LAHRTLPWRHHVHVTAWAIGGGASCQVLVIGAAPSNACLSLSVGPSALAVQVLMELRSDDHLVVMVNSREGMGSGAPLSHGVLEQVLDVLAELSPGAALIYRSDRDGPIRSGRGQRNQT